jgi:hypothetical protein
VIVVSDTSPLIALHAIRRLDLLEALYHQILIPDAVSREYLTQDATDSGSRQRARPWLVQRELPNTQAADILKMQLGAGEAEAIALSLGVTANLLLMDERRGRHTAERLGILCLGTIGVLLQAKQRGLITVLRPELEALIGEADFWLSDALLRGALALAGEA